MSERLEEIMNDLPYSIRHEGSVEALIEYAKEQAERVQGLEERGVEIIKINQHEMKYRARVETRNIELEQQNKRYREYLVEAKSELTILSLPMESQIRNTLEVLNEALAEEE